jgi:transcriptional regulator of aromatic amino acid metabolism
MCLHSRYILSRLQHLGEHRRPIEMVADARFREDLCFRLDVVSLEITPLTRAPECPHADESVATLL